MPGSDTWELVKEFLFPGRSARRAIPPLDGGLTPNDALDEIGTAISGIAEPDDIVRDASGAVYVTSGNKVLRSSGERLTEVASLPGEAGAITLDADGGLLVCVAGTGLLRVDRDGATEVLVDSAKCPTDVVVAADGTVYLTDGSSAHHGPEWVHDLMEQNALGRLLRYEPGTRRTTELLGGLSYASGVTLTADQDALLVCEAWAHRIIRVPLDDPAAARPVRENLPGYPGRINDCPGGYWLAVFALRTQLVEFTMTQRDYVREMMRTIEPDYWIRPALRSLNSGLEPLQGGQIRKLGVIKPWAPPRSYGLLARLDEDGYVLRSLHSRGGSRRHGVTSAKQYGDRLYIAVRGGDEVLLTEAGDRR
jgi:hypothetical protein